MISKSIVLSENPACDTSLPILVSMSFSNFFNFIASILVEKKPTKLVKSLPLKPWAG